MASPSHNPACMSSVQVDSTSGCTVMHPLVTEQTLFRRHPCTAPRITTFNELNPLLPSNTQLHIL